MSDLIPPSPTYDPTGTPPADDHEFFARDEPLALFEDWFKLAKEKEPHDPNAMALATADASGAPDVRMVLLKDVGTEGFSFYSNAESAKGVQIEANPRVALCFYWKSIRRQVRVRGALEPVPDAAADAYFQSRDRGARLGAWASEQSRPLPDRLALEKRVAEFALKFGLGAVPRPEFWRGWRVVPNAIEFWRDRPFRLHDRLLFERDAPGQPWRKVRLYP